MFWNLADKAGRVLAPVLIHFLAVNVISIWNTSLGLHTDAAFLTCMAALAVLPIFLWMYKKDRQREAAETPRRTLRALDGAGIALFAVLCNLMLTAVLNRFLAGKNFSNAAQEALFGSGLAVQLLGVGILVPIMEEVLFRGLVYKRLRGYTRHIWAAALGAAAIFALYHGNVIQALFAFPMGILLILVYEGWKDLRAPVIFHMAVNLSSVLMTAYQNLG